MHSYSQLSRWFYRRATLPAIGVFLVLLIVFRAWIFPSLQARMRLSTPLEQLDARIGFAANEAHEYLIALGEGGREVYWWTELVVDSLFPIVYTVSSILLISYLFDKAFAEGSIWRRLNLLPLLVMLADYLENTAILALLSSFPVQNGVLAQLASIANGLKWGLAPMIFILLLIGAGGWIAGERSRSKRH
ncbi:hypothetical protein [Telluribacter sp. SYSU D00476]|uniref:hypothetical protein n=1 Tax=Telluribacter sp. SYSU D00476 TaxID=2811430 RepID=UPI001FF5A021|nr:hypothetical protein [Telluribacter sp. SYSU D00476]